MKKYLFIPIFFCFFHISCHSQHLFLQERNNLYGYVDALGKTVIPFEYSFAFTDTLATIAFVVEGDRIKAIDRKSNKLFTVYNYDNGPDYVCEGLFRIIDEHTGFFGFADMEGHILIPPAYTFVMPFSQGMAAFNEGGKIEVTDRINNYSTIKGGKWGLIDRTGSRIFPAIFDTISFPDNNTIEVSIEEHSFYLEKKK